MADCEVKKSVTEILYQQLQLLAEEMTEADGYRLNGMLCDFRHIAKTILENNPTEEQKKEILRIAMSEIEILKDKKTAFFTDTINDLANFIIDNITKMKNSADVGLTTEPNDIFKKMEEKGYVLVRKQYFESMSKSFERLFEALTTNSPGNTSKAMRDLEFIRSGFNCKKAEQVSEYFKSRLLLTDEKLKEFAEPTINSIGKD